jgi:hypothetical protein
MDVGVQLAEEIESLDHVAGVVQLAQPFLQLRPVVRIAGKAVLDQFHLLFGGILEWKEAGGRLDETFDGVVVAKVDVHFAQDAQPPRWLREDEDGDGIAVDVTQPAHGCRRFRIQTPPHDMDVVSLARPQHGTVGTERDRLMVMVLRLVDDADALHDAITSASRGRSRACSSRAATKPFRHQGHKHIGMVCSSLRDGCDIAIARLQIHVGRAA